MPKKIKKFADDGWAIWIEGDDTSTVYLNYWANPRGKSYVDVSVKILGIKNTKNLNVYLPFRVEESEIEDISLRFHDEKIARATFSAGCLVDYQKNEYTSEIAYNGKTVDIVHISQTGFSVEYIPSGTIIKIDIAKVLPFVENDEGYFAFRIPHKSLDEVFKTYTTVKSWFKRLIESITSPVISENYGYSVRINEARLLPPEINRIGSLHRQKLKKTVISMSISDDYEITDADCFRVRRVEEELYKDYVPKKFDCESAITYQWSESRGENYKGQFNFYFDISKNAMSSKSFVAYLILLVFFGMMGDVCWDLIKLIFKIPL